MARYFEGQVGLKALIPEPDSDTWNYLFLERSNVFEGETERRVDVPGGRIEFDPDAIPPVVDESPEDGLEREVLDETGLQLLRGGVEEPFPLEMQFIRRQPAEPDVLRITCLAKAAIGPITLSDEHTADSYIYLPRTEALELNLDPYMRALFEQERKFTFEQYAPSELSLYEAQGVLLTGAK